MRMRLSCCERKRLSYLHIDLKSFLFNSFVNFLCVTENRKVKQDPALDYSISAPANSVINQSIKVQLDNNEKGKKSDSK